uniref:NB-ARC domain-containing protein n=1 Tax=Setaria italica TaxID=4555 RepID=K3ZLK2_SETIT
MVGVGEFLASAALKKVGGMLGSAIWEAIASQLKLGDELKGLKDTVDTIQNSMVRAEKRLMKDGDVCVWMRKLKAAAYDMEDIIIGIGSKLKAMKQRLDDIEKLRQFDLMVDTSSDDQDVIQTRATGPCLVEGILGRDKDKVELMKLLQEDCKHIIIPIYGFGGLDFDIQIWVYVSTSFSDEKIGRSIISQVDGQSNQYDLSSVQMRVEMILRGKKYLIVLDDLWEENTGQLEKIEAMLKGGAPGRKIIVTTRSEQVAKRLNRELPFKLGALPYDDCWKLFKAKAFPNGIKESEMAKVHMGEKIVKKCGFIIEKRELIHKWIALRFVLTTHRAEEYLLELCQMSFLEASSDSISISARYSKLNNPHMHNVLFKMHDLVHELARSVAIEEVAICDGKQRSFGKEDNYRYTLLLNFKGQYPKCKDTPFKARAAHFSGCTGCQPSKGAFSETKWLRVLDFPRMQTVQLPSSMQNLHHLQFLNLSENTSLKKLHSSFSEKLKLHSSTSICDFQKLHYLDLHGCSNLSELPGPIHRLQVLEHLDLSGCTRLQKLPSRFGELRKLSFLNLSCCSKLEMLPDSFSLLENLEHLDLSGCTSLQKLPSQFGELPKLSFLNLSCCSKLEMLPDSFSLLKNLEHLNLSSCCQLKQLRTLSFNRMKGLLYLNMSGCTCLEALPEFCVGNNGCLNLEILDLSDCARLIDLSESCARLNKLRFLNLSGCPCILKIICFLGKFVNLEYLNLSALSGFDVRKDSEAPSSSTQHSSDYSGEELSLKMLHDTLKNMHRLEYLSVGGIDLLTLPDFVVSESGSSGDCSNIILLQNILDSTNSELNIKCLEVVKSAEEAKGVQLGRRHRLASLSLEWSLLEWSEEPKVTTMDVLENLKPHPALKHLTIKGYNYSMFPSWMRKICSTLPNLVKLVLSDLVECDQLPTLGNLSNLEELEIRNMPKLMEALHELEIDCLEMFDRFDELRCMDRLAKLTLSSPGNFLDRDKAAILQAIPHIQCIKINE